MKELGLCASGYSGAPGHPPTIPGYRILGFAGQGAFGTVWFAEECVTASRRAIKVIPKSTGDQGFHSDREMQGVRRYQESASDHANLVQVYHVGENEEAYFYVMEAADPLPGKDGQGKPSVVPLTLAALIKSQGTIPPAEALRITADVLCGLEHLHGQGCVHRDVKPSSVLMIGG